jgi:hypothetical protein
MITIEQEADLNSTFITHQSIMGCQQSTAGIAEPDSAAKNNHAEQALSSTKLVLAGLAPLASDNISNKVALAAGCFWGTQKYIEKGRSLISSSRSSFFTSLCLTSMCRLSEKVSEFYKENIGRFHESTHSAKD